MRLSHWRVWAGFPTPSCRGRLSSGCGAGIKANRSNNSDGVFIWPKANAISINDRVVGAVSRNSRLLRRKTCRRIFRTVTLTYGSR